METFLRSEMNKFLREANKEKLVTYGPFVRLLYFTFNEPSTVEVHSTTVYHGMNLIQSDIDFYKRSADDNTTLQWMSFTSTTASREFAESFGTNTLFIMELKKVYEKEKRSIDIDISLKRTNQQEILLSVGIEFTVEKVQSVKINMEHSSVALNSLPDEILMIILKKLFNVEILYSLICVNKRLHAIVHDPIFTSHLTLMRCVSDDFIDPLLDPILDQFRLQILPETHHKIKWLTIESSSMKHILLATNYPNLYGLGLYDIQIETAVSLY
ncbi:unnamed protein product [Rotaria sp. Silwood2]|nr:unnamed protein product [Rotaria sp. Silwood2]